MRPPLWIYSLDIGVLHYQRIKALIARYMFAINLSNALAKNVATLLCFWNVPGSNLGPELVCSDVYRRCPQFFPRKC
jgi:hypothetical protein